MLHTLPHQLRPGIALPAGLDRATRNYAGNVETAICIVGRHRRDPIQIDDTTVRADFTCQDAAIAARALLLHAKLIEVSGAAICRHGRFWSVVGIRPRGAAECAA